jgi:hypothetical protein
LYHWQYGSALGHFYSWILMTTGSCQPPCDKYTRHLSNTNASMQDFNGKTLPREKVNKNWSC